MSVLSRRRGGCQGGKFTIPLVGPPNVLPGTADSHAACQLVVSVIRHVTSPPALLNGSSVSNGQVPLPMVEKSTAGVSPPGLLCTMKLSVSIKLASMSWLSCIVPEVENDPSLFTLSITVGDSKGFCRWCDEPSLKAADVRLVGWDRQRLCGDGCSVRQGDGRW